MLKLYTFALSNFCEKPRWALDRWGEPYREIRLVPGAHMLTTRRLARRSTVPLLVDGGAAVQGSQAILDHLEQRGARHDFASPGRVAPFASEEQSDRAFGRSLQTLFYHATLSDRPTTTALWCQGGPAWAPHFLKLTYPVVARRVRSMYRATPEGAAEARRALDAGLEVCDAQLERFPYLGGEEPSRWDLGVAALLAALVRPPTHPMQWPEPSGALQSLARELCARPTLRHVAKLYAERRAGRYQNPVKSGEPAPPLD